MPIHRIQFIKSACPQFLTSLNPKELFFFHPFLNPKFLVISKFLRPERKRVFCNFCERLLPLIFMLLLNAKHELGINETTQGGDFLSPKPLPDLPPANYESKISPSIVLIVVILAAIFFVSGILHLFVRILFRSTAMGPEESQNATALQGQLQELFQLHDAGVDQSFIDMLPIFLYRTIIGLNDPFDCAVCLSQFEPEDKLRLLPKCSHAFHIECIDTWLLSHSTCPLCRRSLFPEFSPARCLSPVVLVVESGSETSRDILGEELGLNSLCFSGEDCLDSPKSDLSMKPGQLVAKGESSLALIGFPDEDLVTVKLGKFRNADMERGEGCSNGSGNREQSQRRCFSMGSYEYMLDESCMLQVAITPVKKKPTSYKSGRRVGASDCDFHSRSEGFKIVDESNFTSGSAEKSTPAACLQKESFSFSKIWLRGRGGKEEVDGESRRRTFSFRFPLPGVLSEEKKAREEFETVQGSENSGNDVDFDVEAGSFSSFGSRVEKTPSFPRRTLRRIIGGGAKSIEL